jgi:hypothetical protein
MPLTSAGKTILAQAMAKGLSGAPLVQLWLGVGDGTEPFSNGQLDLQGTHKARAPALPGFPLATGNVVRARGEFGTSEANFHWQEMAVFTAASGGVMIARAVTDFGSKVNSKSWQFGIDLTIDLA